MTDDGTKEISSTFFAPQLYFKSGTCDIDFYIKGFGAIELRRWTNDDGSIHVSELSIDGAVFQLHEESPEKGRFEPIQNKGVTSLIGLYVSDVDAVMQRAIAAGAS